MKRGAAVVGSWAGHAPLEDEGVWVCGKEGDMSVVRHFRELRVYRAAFDAAI